MWYFVENDIYQAELIEYSLYKSSQKQPARAFENLVWKMQIFCLKM